jgi:hypothetical protein
MLVCDRIRQVTAARATIDATRAKKVLVRRADSDDLDIRRQATWGMSGEREVHMKIKYTLAALVVGLGISTGAAWAEMAKGDQITAAISGNTVQGNMDSTGPYAEFYAADGTVFGKDYKAKWFIEGDTMCWIYDGSPKDCWSIELSGDQVKWVKDNKAQGSGTIAKGNPNDFK